MVSGADGDDGSDGGMVPAIQAEPMCSPYGFPARGPVSPVVFSCTLYELGGESITLVISKSILHTIYPCAFALGILALALGPPAGREFQKATWSSEDR